MKKNLLSPTYLIASAVAAALAIISISSCSIREANAASRTWEDHTLGLGVVLGEPSGFTGKYFLDSHQAIDAGFAYSFSSYFLLWADYLYHFQGVFKNSNSDFLMHTEPFVGGGGILFFSSGTSNAFFSTASTVGGGVRIPFGMEWRPSTVPIGVFIQLAPGLGFFPSTFGFFQAGIGGLYYFD